MQTVSCLRKVAGWDTEGSNVSYDASDFRNVMIVENVSIDVQHEDCLTFNYNPASLSD